MIWVLVLCFIAAFVLAFGLGANDVSNAFATSIGAKVINLKTACIIASFAELAGSVLLGGLVTESIIKFTIKPDILSSSQMLFGMLSVLVTVGFLLIIATWLKLPVSTTHAVISSIVGFTLVANSDAANWGKMVSFFYAWALSPVLAGASSILVFIALYYLILRSKSSFRRGVIAIPFIYTLTVVVNISLVFYQVLNRFKMDPSSFTFWQGMSIGCVVAIGLLTWLVATFLIVPYIKKSIYRKASKLDPDICPDLDSYLLNVDEEATHKQTERLFAFLQILSAVFTSFVHGSNDVSNSIGPIYGATNAFLSINGKDQIDSTSPIIYGLLLYGAVGMILGLFIWGSRVIETIGENLTVLSPSRGFAVEFGSALTVLMASVTGLSVSTTHCKVGSIVAVGLVSSLISKKQQKHKQASSSDSLEPKAIEDPHPSVNFKLILGIVASWVCTIPISGAISAGIYYLLSFCQN